MEQLALIHKYRHIYTDASQNYSTTKQTIKKNSLKNHPNINMNRYKETWNCNVGLKILYPYKPATFKENLLKKLAMMI